MSQFYKAHGFERTNAGNANKVFLHAFLQFLQKNPLFPMRYSTFYCRERTLNA